MHRKTPTEQQVAAPAVANALVPAGNIVTIRLVLKPLSVVSLTCPRTGLICNYFLRELNSGGLAQWQGCSVRVLGR